MTPEDIQILRRLVVEKLLYLKTLSQSEETQQKLRNLLLKLK